jgi:hypothetical protein
MKKVLLLIVFSTLLVASGFAQIPAANSNTDQTNIKGCLGGSDGNYTIAEDNTGQIFRITTSSVDLKPQLGHDVRLAGSKANGAVSSGTADNSFAVTELKMISEQCAAVGSAPAAAAPSATVSTPDATTPAPASAPAATASAPDAAAVAPAATVSTPDAAAATPAATVSTPDATAAAPAATASTPDAAAAAPAATVSTPDATAAAPAATVSTPVESPAPLSAGVSKASQTVDTTARATHPKRASARHGRQLANPAVAEPTPAATDSTSTPDANTVAAAATTPAATSQADSTPAATTPAATTPAPAVRKGGFPTWLGIALVLLILVIGALTPLFSRMRKRRMLERTGTPNLSFTKETTSEHDKNDKPATPRAA